MPNFPIIDTHLHVWDQTRLKYSAFEGSPLFGHPYHVEDYRRDCGDVQVEAMVFLECYADFWEGGGQYIEEVEFVEDEATLMLLRKLGVDQAQGYVIGRPASLALESAA